MCTLAIVSHGLNSSEKPENSVIEADFLMDFLNCNSFSDLHLLWICSEHNGVRCSKEISMLLLEAVINAH